MFRPFMRVPPSLLEPPRPQPTTNPTRILRLPTSLLDHIFDDLTLLDRCTLALTCRTLLTYANLNEQLDYIIQNPPLFPDLQRFFTYQLGPWVPHDLRYCPDCGKFISTSAHHWRHKSEKYTREHTGRVSALWRERREDGWLRYWIERWCDDGSSAGDDESSATARALQEQDRTLLVCPRCAIVSPDTNAWRVMRVEKRNSKRHQEAMRRGGRPLVTTAVRSPGLGSPVERGEERLGRIVEGGGYWI